MRHTQNAFLMSSLPEEDRAFLRPYLKLVELSQRGVLHEQGEPITEAVFPFDAVISSVVVLADGEPVEAAAVGYDGVVGGSAAIAGDVALNRTVVQVAGQGLQCSVDDLRHAVKERPLVRHALCRHQEVLLSQALQSAACNITHGIEARLARWLLRARDLSGSEEVNLTQQSLSEILGVRRTSVSLIAHTLQTAGLIEYKRGHIHLIDINGLNETACECYAAVKSNYAALLSGGTYVM